MATKKFVLIFCITYGRVPRDLMEWVRNLCNLSKYFTPKNLANILSPNHRDRIPKLKQISPLWKWVRYLGLLQSNNAMEAKSNKRKNPLCFHRNFDAQLDRSNHPLEFSWNWMYFRQVRFHKNIGFDKETWCGLIYRRFYWRFLAPRLLMF